MSVIEQFLNDYRNKVNMYEKLAQLCAYQCESGLKRIGLRALVTFRAKRLDSLMEKVTARAGQKQYKTIEDIYEDIVDLAGVRIALYFPGDRDEVDTFIRSNFNVELTKDFPRETDFVQPYPKRFAGYSARHYRLRLKESTLSDEDKHFANHVIELQLGSVLMHAWAEVEHDLVYKPRPGLLSHDEYAILDELNGLMHAGEIALERLQRAVKRRINTELQPFSNHYELSSYLYDYLKLTAKEDIEPFIGRTDVLFCFLQLIGCDSIPKLEPYLRRCSPNSKQRPIAEQIIDQILMENDDFYKAYNEARLIVGKTDPFGAPHEALSYFTDKRGLGLFMRQWIAVENMIGHILGNALLNGDSNLEPLQQVRDRIVDKETLERLNQIRQLRNQILYGDEWPSEEELMEAGKFLESVMDDLVKENLEMERLISREVRINGEHQSSEM